MAGKSLVQIEGFADLHRQLVKLPDAVKRKELLKIMGQVANPTLKAAKTLVPVSKNTHYRYVNVRKGRRRGKGKVPEDDKISIESGNLKRSLKKIVAKRSKINPVLHIGAKAKKRRTGKAKADGYYAHMVVAQGFKGKNRVSGNKDFFNQAFNQTKGIVTADAERRVAKYIQKQINRLSK